jgi:preprotein translocase subunit SecD
MPLLITPDASMVQSGMQGWNFVNIHSEIQNGNAVAFSFDSRGAKLFGDLTMRWYNVVRRRSDNSHARLAIMLDNKIISAPKINTPITGGSGVITGEGPGGFTRDEMDRLISAMNSGAQPATQPASPLKSGN